MSFKYGDTVKRKEGMWKHVSAPVLEKFDKFKVTAYFADQKYPTVCFEESGSYQWDASFFTLVEEEKVNTKFIVGDKVISTKNTPDAPEGFVGYIFSTDGGVDWDYIVQDRATARIEYFKEDELELLSFAPKKKEESIARPILEERKIGKVRMDLFNEGFPNAVLEIAKVMTWANQNKGYKDHDWKNLPDADKNLPAAASRHGIKQLIQKSKGVPAIDRVDEESKIVHLAHQCFNCLAELELVLTGVIK